MTRRSSPTSSTPWAPTQPASCHGSSASTTRGSGLALRGTFIISPDGTLFNSEVNFYNMGRNIDELMRKFKANLYLARKADEGCPSKWKDDGDKTLRPGPEMVGRVHEALNE